MKPTQSAMPVLGYRHTRRPAGRPTRGKTAPNRLRRVDVFALLYAGSLLARTRGLLGRAYFVDLGYGATPVTTLESAMRLRSVNPTLPILGVEIDRKRVDAAQPFAGEGIEFRLGGFNLPLGIWQRGPWAGMPEHARMVRAFNVLRQYDEAAAHAAYDCMAAYVLPGGLLIEGTSTSDGSLWVANIARRTAVPLSPGESLPGDALWHMEALVFSQNFRRPFDPRLHQAVLPKHFIHHMASGHPVDDFMTTWRRSVLETAGYRVWGNRAWWVAAAKRLAAQGYSIDTRDRWLNRGYLLWLNPQL